jgi:hypothetical protein
VLVDGEATPSTFGTGSEDYFNYSWSRPELFAHPYCGQPLDSGPDTSGYVSNHRFQVLDAIAFEKSLAVFLELWAHNRTPGLSYARIAYHYARPGAIDDHRGLMPSDLKIPPLLKREPKAAEGQRARFSWRNNCTRTRPPGVEMVAWSRHATPGRPVARREGQLTMTLPIEKADAARATPGPGPSSGRRQQRVFLTASRPGCGGAEEVRLQSAFHAPRVLNVHFDPVDLAAGSHEMTPSPLARSASWDFLRLGERPISQPTQELS